jgi:hypothetical protein
MKDFGKHRRLLFDTRVRGMFAWLAKDPENGTYSAEQIYSELEAYEQHCLEVFGTISSIDKYNKSFDKFGDFLKDLLKKAPELEPDLEVISIVRSAFMHNQTPPPVEYMQPDNGYIIESVLNALRRAENNVVKRLNSLGV